MVKVPRDKQLRFEFVPQKKLKPRVKREGENKKEVSWVEVVSANVRGVARRLYKVVEISTNDDTTIIKVRDMVDEERVAEDMLRAEEKLRRKMKKVANQVGDTAGSDVGEGETGGTDGNGQTGG